MKEQNSAFQQIISLLGLVISLLVAITPLFTKSPISPYFLDTKIIQAFTFIILISSISLIWYFTQISTSPTLQLFGVKDKTYKFITNYRINIATNGFIKLAIIFVIFFGILFVGLFHFFSQRNLIVSFIQGLAYLFMFISLMSLFSILYAQTKAQRIIEDLKEQFPVNILETLNKYKLINSGIEISHNEILSTKELLDLKLDPNQYMFSKKIKIKTVTQEVKSFTLVVDYAGKQVFKIVKINSSDK